MLAATVRVIQAEGLDRRVQSFCTGVAFGPREVLTASHCVDAESPKLKTWVVPGEGKSVEVLPGGDALVRNIVQDEANFIEVAYKLTHPTVDVATLSLSSRTTSWVALGYSADLANGRRLTRAGFGQRGARLGLLKSAGVEVVHTDERDLWVVSPEGQGACQGDSGGGLFQIERGQARLVGILTDGHKRCIGADRYVRVSGLAGWLYNSQKGER